MKRFLYIFILICIPFSILAQEKKELDAELIYVSFDKTKHIVLPEQVSDIAYGREDFVKVERVENVPNIVRITAQEEDFRGSTNVVIVCTDGSVHSYRIVYLPDDVSDNCENVVYANGVNRSRCYTVVVNNHNTTEMFFPNDVLYLRQGNEEALGVEYYNNMVKIGTTFDNFEPSNLFVVDKEFNTYEITLYRGYSDTYSYNFDDGRQYVAHIDVNAIEMNRLINILHSKERNIFSVGVIKNKFEMSLANLYVKGDFMFFVFDIKNFSNIDYDIDFVKCFLRDMKKSKNSIQQEVPYDPVYQRDFEKKILGKSRNRFVLAFNKFTIPDDKVFEIEMFEKGGGRHMKLSVLNEYILRAELLN